MIVELREIHKKFGEVYANNGITLTFTEGRIFGVLGENGAGKSTLMKILSGVLSPDDGSIWIDGRRHRFDSPRAAIRCGIGLLPQDPLDVEVFSVLENFMYGTQHGFFLNRREARIKFEQLTHELGFELDPQALTSSLNISERQQLEILRLLALHVHTLILDEPTTGISVSQKQTLFNALRRLTRDDSKIVILVSHKLDDVMSLCDRVDVLRAGRLVDSCNLPVPSESLVRMMFGKIVKQRMRSIVDLSRSKKTLQAVNITIRTPRVSVNDLTLDVHEGEIIGFAGLDGSGQELVVRAIVGLQQLSHGRVYTNNKNMTSQNYHAFLNEGVTFCSDGRTAEGLVSGLTVVEHMVLMSETATFIGWGMARRKMDALITRHQIHGQPFSRIDALSGGNQQRLLMALLPDHPKVLVLENPTRGLDLASTNWVWEQLLNRCKRGTSIVVSSSDLDELVNYCDRILIFHAGHVFELHADIRDTSEIGRLIGGDFDGENYRQLA